MADFNEFTDAGYLGTNVNITDSTDATKQAKVSTSGDVSVSDGIHSGGVNGSLSLTTANTAYEAKVGGSRLSNRKTLTIMSEDTDLYWGYSNSVTTSNGTKIYKNQFATFELDPNDSSVQIWIVSASNSKTARITEAP